jgi:acetyl-CoA acetyltransferase
VRFVDAVRAVAAASIVAGDIAIAGGVEVISRVPMFSHVGEADPLGSMNARYDDQLAPQGTTNARRGIRNSGQARREP